MKKLLILLLLLVPLSAFAESPDYYYAYIKQYTRKEVCAQSWSTEGLLLSKSKWVIWDTLSVTKIGNRLYYSTKNMDGYRAYAYDCINKRNVLLLRPSIIKKIIAQYQLPDPGWWAYAMMHYPYLSSVYPETQSWGLYMNFMIGYQPRSSDSNPELHVYKLDIDWKKRIIVITFKSKWSFINEYIEDPQEFYYPYEIKESKIQIKF